MKPTVLILEDDRVFRTLVSDACRSRGVEVVEATSGADADAKLEAVSPSAIIVDGLLPDTDGLDWIKSYRQAGGQAPILFASAFWHDMQSYRSLTATLGVATVLRKPMDPKALIRQLSQVLFGSPDVAESRQQLPGGSALLGSDACAYSPYPWARTEPSARRVGRDWLGRFEAAVPELA